jgi:hypothetical protein
LFSAAKVKVPLDLELFGQFNRSKTSTTTNSKPLVEKVRNSQPEPTAAATTAASREENEAGDLNAGMDSEKTASSEAGVDVTKLQAENSALNKLLEALLVKPPAVPSFQVLYYTVNPFLKLYFIIVSNCLA